VNHQIQHHVDIRPPLAKRAEAMAFDEDGPPDIRPHDPHHGIESFTVSDLQSAVASLRNFHELTGFSRHHGKRLLDQHVFPGLQTTARYLIVHGGGNSDADDINLRQQLFEVPEQTNPVSIGDQLPSLRREIDDTDQSGPGKRRVEARMMLAQVPNPDDACS
jgi:hypothetical protein